MTLPGAAHREEQGARGNKRKRQSKYLQHSGKKSTIAAGVQGFLVTCMGGKERQSIKEIISLLDQFSEDLAHKDATTNEGDQARSTDPEAGDCSQAKKTSEVRVDSESVLPLTEANDLSSETSEDLDDESLGWVKCRRLGESSNAKGSEEPERERPHEHNSIAENHIQRNEKNEERKGFDELLAAEIDDLRDPKKARFTGYETGCNGVIFVRMQAQNNRLQSGPKELAEAIVRDAAASKKSRSRFIMRLLPVELTCYASPDELRKVAEPLILRHFPTDLDQPSLKFAVICECRANTNLNKLDFIHALAKMVPEPHKVDLKNPDKTILVQIVKTACAVGVVQHFKELAKYNLKQLTSQAENTAKGQVD